jgi:N-acetylglucosaminyldiphosphoundecaprenol N-acetyl-beta-D-mannosaminyltransferase
MSEDNIEDDFNRDIWCLLGLVFDAVDLELAVESVHLAASINRSCFISTPNINFTIAALADPEFRNTVINSDLSLVDGMPLLWMARVLGTGLVAKVSGSDLFDKLWLHSPSYRSKMKVFFFGGPDGIAESACQKINDIDAGLTCVGFLNPGFGSLEEISDRTIIDRLNVSQADFLIVSLGAKKGQTWIQQNHSRLNIPIISHLGAVLNLVAGNVERAPLWMQRSGLEWTWRILQEPHLWQRYFSDGLGFTKLFVTRVLPYAFWRLTHARLLANEQPVCCKVDSNQDQVIIKINGSCLDSTIEPLRAVYCEASAASKSVRLDLSNVPVVDAAFLGLSLVLLKHVKNAGHELSVSGLNSDLVRIFRWNCVEYLL